MPIVSFSALGVPCDTAAEEQHGTGELEGEQFAAAPLVILPCKTHPPATPFPCPSPDAEEQYGGGELEGEQFAALNMRTFGALLNAAGAHTDAVLGCAGRAALNA